MAIAKKDNEESLLARRRELAERELAIASSEEELDSTEKKLNATTEALNGASVELFDLIYNFIVAGFKFAGATDEMADKLAGLVNIENLPELKAKSLFGAGSVDFTKGGDR